MKKLLTTLASLTTIITPIITTSNLSINGKSDNNINCDDQSWQGRSKQLLNVTKESYINLKLTLGIQYSGIDKSIFNKANVFKGENQLASGFTVAYFSDAEGKTSISNQEQVARDIWVKITAAADDPKWRGTTNPIKITINKADLNDNPFTDLQTVITVGKKYSEISTDVFNNADIFPGKKNLATGFTVAYFSDQEGKKSINNDNKQVAGNIWVKITAAANDPIWTGTTNLFKLTITDSRTNLENAVTNLAGMEPIVVDTRST